MSKSKNPNSSTTVCPSCNGRGNYQASGINFSLVTYPCAVCKGTGTIARARRSPKDDKTTPNTDIMRQWLIDAGSDPFKK